MMLRADLKTFISDNIRWIHEACADLLVKWNMKVEELCKAFIELSYQFDELAISVVCKMKNMHCLVLCDNTHWTT